MKEGEVGVQDAIGCVLYDEKGKLVEEMPPLAHTVIDSQVQTEGQTDLGLTGLSQPISH